MTPPVSLFFPFLTVNVENHLPVFCSSPALGFQIRWAENWLFPKFQWNQYSAGILREIWLLRAEISHSESQMLWTGRSSSHGGSASILKDWIPPGFSIPVSTAGTSLSAQDPPACSLPIVHFTFPPKISVSLRNGWFEEVLQPWGCSMGRCRQRTEFPLSSGEKQGIPAGFSLPGHPKHCKAYSNQQLSQTSTQWSKSWAFSLCYQN